MFKKWRKKKEPTNEKLPRTAILLGQRSCPFGLFGIQNGTCTCRQGIGARFGRCSRRANIILDQHNAWIFQSRVEEGSSKRTIARELTFQVGAIGWGQCNTDRSERQPAVHNAHQTLPFDPERRLYLNQVFIPAIPAPFSRDLHAFPQRHSHKNRSARACKALATRRATGFGKRISLLIVAGAGCRHLQPRRHVEYLWLKPQPAPRPAAPAFVLSNAAFTPA